MHGQNGLDFAIDTRERVVVPQPHISRAILARVRLLPDYPQLRLLDLSCGAAEIATRLMADGVPVRGTRYRPDDYILAPPSPPAVAARPTAPPFPVDDGIDLTKPLPYQPHQFDVVLMTEVLEHLERHDVVLQEAARVLRPGGWLIFTTPNLQRIHSRWHFFLTGTHKLIRRPLGWDIDASQAYAYHIRPVDFPVLHTQLHQCGLRVRELGWTQFKWRHAPWFLLVPVIWLLARWEFRRHRKETTAYNDGRRDLRRWMSHPAMLGSEQLMVLAQKDQASSNHPPLKEADDRASL